MERVGTITKQRLFFLILLALAALGALPLHAAEVSVVGPREIGIGEVGVFDVIIDAEGEVINAVEGTFTLRGGTVRLGEVFRGGSVLSFWLGTPAVTGNDIAITGIMPGGYGGRSGKLFSFEVSGTAEGVAEMSFSDLRVLRHDGQGSDTAVNNSYELEVVVRDEPVLGDLGDPNRASGDNTPPELFEPVIVEDDGLANGAVTAVFDTTDKGDGVSYFEVQEQLFGGIEQDAWIRTESPYTLRDQWRLSTVYVKAVDNAGNVRIVSVAPDLSRVLVVLFIFLICIIILLIVVMWLIWRNRKLRRDRDQQTADQ